MDIITMVLIGIIGLFALIGAWRGLSGELSRLVGLVAFVGLLWFSYPMIHRTILQIWPTLDEKGSILYACLVALLLAGLVAFLLIKVTNKVVSLIIPQPYNALIGALIGATKIILILSVIGGVLTTATRQFDDARSYVEKRPFAKAMVEFWGQRFKEKTSSQTRPDLPIFEVLTDKKKAIDGND